MCIRYLGQQVRRTIDKSRPLEMKDQARPSDPDMYKYAIPLNTGVENPLTHFIMKHGRLSRHPIIIVYSSYMQQQPTLQQKQQ